MKAEMHTVGLALSGGGARAAAFHRGTLRALMDLGLVERIDVISTVSGGSVFGGAWMAARMRNISDSDFLQHIRQELRRGFVLRSIRPRLLMTALPGIAYSRTNVIARTFDNALFHCAELQNLPERPSLCINTTILNNGQVGKFSRLGFSAWGLHLQTATPHRQIPMPGFRLASAVAASAAFPVGLPPFELRLKDFPKGTELKDSLAGARRIALTDGGVLENLGIQTLLKSERFGTWNMIVSDAGVAWQNWTPGALLNPVRSFGVWMLSGRILDQILVIMNDKQNRWARQQVIEQTEHAASLDTPHRQRRNVLFVRVAQNWNRFMAGIPKGRLKELETPSNQLNGEKAPDEIERFLQQAGIDLSVACDYYEKLGKDAGADSVNRTPTNFTALSDAVLDRLEAHAAWQIHAAHAIYGL